MSKELIKLNEGMDAPNVEKVAIDTVKENPNNPRDIALEDRENLIASIKKYPHLQKYKTLYVSGDEVVAGNQRLSVYKELGLKFVFIKRVDDLSEEELKALVLIDNTHAGSFMEEMVEKYYRLDDYSAVGLKHLNDFSIDSELIDFTPNTNPDSSAIHLTQDEIDQKKKELEEKFSDPVEAKKVVTCPHCYEEIYL